MFVEELERREGSVAKKILLFVKENKREFYKYA